LRSAFEQYPGDFWIHLRLGLILPEDRAAGAVAHLLAGTTLRPTAVGTRFNLAKSLGSIGDYEGAIAESRETLRLDTNLVQIRKILATMERLAAARLGQMAFAAPPELAGHPAKPWRGCVRISTRGARKSVHSTRWWSRRCGTGSWTPT